MPAMSPELSTRIETDRLILRAYELGDVPMYFRMSQRNKDHLRQFESGNAVMIIESEQDAERVIRDFIDGWKSRKYFFLGAFLKGSQEFAAQVYVGVVNPDLPEFEIGYIAEVNHEGQGYVTEAVKAALAWVFNSLGAHRVRLGCDEKNLRSIRVAERCGFVREGFTRETKRHRDGSLTGDVHYGLLWSEYLNEVT